MRVPKFSTLETAEYRYSSFILRNIIVLKYIFNFMRALDKFTNNQMEGL
jgi:hypothetical protein